MGRLTKPLTNTEVDRAKPKDREYNLSDGNGLSLRVKKTGTKSWLFNYFHPQTNKRKNLSIGQYPSISLAAARKSRESAKELLAQRIDPIEYKADQLRQMSIEASLTLEIVARNWFTVKKTSIAESTAKSLIRNIEKHIFPIVGHRPINKISAPEIIEALKPIEASGKLETLSKLIGVLNEIMTFSVNTGVTSHNALSGIRAAFEAPKPVHMPTIKPEGLPSLMKALSYSSLDLVIRCLVEFQLHTMLRPGEAAGVEWSEIDFDEQTLTVRKDRMKKNRTHIVPLTKQTLELLELLRPISGHRTYVFPAIRQPNRSCTNEVANNALKRIGYGGILVAHGMRALASTTLNEQGFNKDVIEMALSHVDDNKVRNAYNHAEYLTQRQEMLKWWSSHIEQAKHTLTGLNS